MKVTHDSKTFLRILEYWYVSKVNQKIGIKPALLLLDAANEFMIYRLMKGCESALITQTCQVPRCPHSRQLLQAINANDGGSEAKQ